MPEQVYGGLAFGATHSSGDFQKQVRDARALDLVPPGGIDAGMDRKFGGRVFAGVRVTPHIALEADLADLGRVQTHATWYGGVFPPAGRLRSERTGRITVSSASLSLAGFLPLSERLEAVVRGGIAYTKSDYHVEGTSFLPQPDGGETRFRSPVPDDRTARQTRPMLAIGAQWRATGPLAVRFEWARYFKVGDVYGVPRVYSDRGRFDYDLFSLGLVYRF